MKRIYHYELKKILGRKIVWAGILLALFVSITNFTSGSISDIAWEQEVAARYEGPLTDEKVQQMLNDFLPTQEQREQWKGINVAYIGQNSMQQAVQLIFANEDGTWNGKTVKDVYGDQEIQIGYHAGWFDFSRCLIRVMIVLAVLAVIMTAPVFAGEYSSMDNILLTSRYGRTKCVTAKLLAALTASLSLTVLFLAGNFAAALLLMGTTGLSSSTAFCGVFYENYMPFNISCRTMLLYQAGLALSAVVMLVGITVLVSALSVSQIVSLIISFALLLAPLMLTLPESHPLFRIIGLLPAWQLQFSSLMAVGMIRGSVFYAAAAFPAAAVMAAIGAILSRGLWQKHQVK